MLNKPPTLFAGGRTHLHTYTHIFSPYSGISSHSFGCSYYVGITSRDYQMACFVLGNNSVTIQEMHAIFSRDGADNEDTKMDIGSSPIGSIG